MKAPFLAASAVMLALFVRDAHDARNAHAEACAPQDASLAPLLTRVANHAARFEQMKLKASFVLTGHMDELDGGGHAAGTKDVIVRVVAEGAKPHAEIVRYTEDGRDKTVEARNKIRERERKKKPSSKKDDFLLPFLASEQGRYTFALVERAAANPSLVRIAFAPHVPAEDAYKGSAWIDSAAGEILSMGFSFSKNPGFIDHVDATLLFALSTPLGRAPSRLTFDARGSFLFVKKRYRGWATITDAHLAP